MKKKVLWIMTLLAALCLMLCACGGGEKTFTFTFDTGDGPAVESVQLAEGTEYTLPAPTAEGWEFGGWYEKADLSGNAVTSAVADGDRTFYGKWVKTYLLTLDVGEGTLGGNTLYLKAGENLLSALSDRSPAAKEGFAFGGWFLEGKEVVSSDVMPEGPLTLTARYKVGYTVEILEQNFAQTGYEKAEELKDYAYATDGEFTPVLPERAGFAETVKPDTVRSKKLSATDPSANLFKVYYDRTEVSVFFESNYPRGFEDKSEQVSKLNGSVIELPEESFRINGYVLIGWSENPTDSTNYYPTNVLEKDLFNAESGKAGTYTMTQNMVLYGVWLRGYDDMFGGVDHIYVTDGSAYLSRGGFMFKGEVEEYKGETIFTFRTGDLESGDILLEGKLFGDGSFCYNDDERRGYTANYYNMATGRVDETISILLDGYNGIDYVKRVGEGRVESHGTYVVGEDGYRVATFETGELAGTSMTLSFSAYADVSGKIHHVFRVRDDEFYGLGVLRCFYVSGGAISAYPAQYYSLVLDGFETAVYTQYGEEAELSYNTDGDMVTLFDSDETLFGVVKLMTQSGVNGYMPYDENLDVTFVTESESLELDGVCNATYTVYGEEDADGNRAVLSEVSGVFGAYNSALGGVLIELTSGRELYTFLAGTYAGDATTFYHFERKLNSYQEYYYSGEGGSEGIYTSPLIAIDDAGEGTFSVYGDVNGLYYYKLADGKYTYDEKTNTYRAVIGNHYDVSVDEMPVDVANIREFVFGAEAAIVDGDTLPAAYWLSYITLGGQTENCETVYTQEDAEDGKLILAGGFAIYQRAGEVVFSGVYETVDTILVVSGFDGSGEQAYGFYELNEEEQTFTVHNSFMRVSMPQVLTDGTISEDIYLSIAGDSTSGAAAYAVRTPDGDGYLEQTWYGTYEATEKVNNFYDTEFPVYRFTSEEGDLTFLFEMFEVNSSLVLFGRENEKLGGIYSAEGVGTLNLDGFGLFGTFLDTEGELHTGLYYLYDEEQNIVCLASVVEGNTYYFEVAWGEAGKDGTLSRRGPEIGNYVLMDNQSLREEIFKMDGLGHLTVVLLDEEGTETVVDAKGSYKLNDYGYVVNYKDEKGRHTLVGAIDTVTDDVGELKVFVVHHEEIVSVLINEADWSVLVLDGFGYALRYSGSGVAEAGMYSIVTDELLYYLSLSGDYASLYRYDLEAETAVPVHASESSYISSDLRAIYFTSYGFVQINGETQYYYEREGGSVKLYMQDFSDPNANEYGYVVRTDLVSSGNTITLDGVDYYESDGYSITFEREEADKENYPYSVDEDGGKINFEELTFSPVGGMEFTTYGTVLLTGETTPFLCLLARFTEDEELRTQLIVMDGYYDYYFDIELKYNGTGGSTFRLTSKTRVEELISYKYLYYSYLMQSMMGSSDTFENTYGTVSLLTKYDADGQETEHLLSADFGENSGVVDVHGNVVKEIEGPYVYEAVSGTSADGSALTQEYFTVEYTAEDGVVYRLHILRQDFSGIDSYLLYAFTSLTVLTDGNYSVDLETVLGTDMTNVPIGDVTIPYLYEEKDGVKTPITFEHPYMIGDTFYGIIDEWDESETSIEKSTVYVIDLTKTEEGYTSMTVTVKQAKTVHYTNPVTFDLGYFQYFEDTHTVTMFTYARNLFFAQECSYDPETGTYLVTSPTGRKYKITEKEGRESTIEEIEEEKEPDTEDGE